MARESARDALANLLILAVTSQACYLSLKSQKMQILNLLINVFLERFQYFILPKKNHYGSTFFQEKTRKVKSSSFKFIGFPYCGPF